MSILKTSYRLLLVSDGTGETAEQMLRAVLVQFPKFQAQKSIERHSNVRTEAHLSLLIEEAKKPGTLLLYTLASSSLRQFLTEAVISLRIQAVDLLGPLLNSLTDFFQDRPQGQSGLLHFADEAYFQRIAALEYTLHHDDGKLSEDWFQADLVLVGVSRTSKTPLSLYLSSHQGWKVANFPLIPGVSLPEALEQLPPSRVVGLWIQAEALYQIRQVRLTRLGQHSGEGYADLASIYAELEWARDFFKKHRQWFTLDVTGKAIEETAGEILNDLSVNKSHSKLRSDFSCL